MMGHDVRTLVDSPSLLNDISSLIESFKPDVLLTNNFDFMTSNPEADAVLDLLYRKGLFSMSWFFESPEIAGGSQFLSRWTQHHYPRHFVIAASDTYFLEFYRQKNLDAFYLPMAVNARDLPSSQSSWLPHHSAELFFSGDSVSGGADQLWSDSELRDYYVRWCLHDLQQLRGFDLQPAMAEQLHDDLQKLFSLRSRFDLYFRDARKQWVNARSNLMLNNVDRIVWAIFGARVDFLFSGYQLAITLRQLLRYLPINLQGSSDWATLVPGLKHAPHRLSQKQLFEFFASSFATLCMTKQTFQHFVHERIFMVLACGGFPITDERQDLWNFFDKRDIATYRYTSEITDLFSFYSRHPERRQEMIDSGRTIVLRDHTYERRAHELVAKFKTYLGRPRGNLLVATPPPSGSAEEATVAK